MSDKYQDTVAKSKVTTNDDEVKAAVEKILKDNLKDARTPENLKLLFSCIDLTTLKSTDSPSSVAKFTERVNDFENEHGDLPSVAAICVYPNFVQVVRTILEVSEVLRDAKVASLVHMSRATVTRRRKAAMARLRELMEGAI